EALPARQAEPPPRDFRALPGEIRRLERQDALLNPRRERQIWFRGVWGDGVEHERDDFREVSGRAVALPQEPLGNRGEFLRPRRESGRRNEPFQTPAREKERRPRGILRRRVAKVRRECRDFRVRRRRAVERFVELSETTHAEYAGRSRMIA